MQDSTRYAGLLARFGALVIDFPALSAIFFPITRMVKGVWLTSASDHRWASGWVVTDPICLVFLVVIASSQPWTGHRASSSCAHDRISAAVGFQRSSTYCSIPT